MKKFNQPKQLSPIKILETYEKFKPKNLVQKL